MIKKFKAENDIGVLVNYTVLGVTENDKGKYVVYTDYFPSDNEIGIRLIVGKMVSEQPFEIKKLRKNEQKEFIDAFILECVKSGRGLKKKSA